MKNEGYQPKGIKSAQNHSSIGYLHHSQYMSLWSDAENAVASQTANDVDTAPGIGSSDRTRADQSIKIKGR